MSSHTLPRRRRPLGPSPRGLRWFPILAAVLVLGACDMGFPDSEGRAPIDEETFVATYTDLRITAMGWESQRLPAEERDAVLESHGVTADDLREFVQVHGRNVPVMNRIWNDISANVQAAREEALGGDEGESDEEEPAPPAAADGIDDGGESSDG